MNATRIEKKQPFQRGICFAAGLLLFFCMALHQAHADSVTHDTYNDFSGPGPAPYNFGVVNNTVINGSGDVELIKNTGSGAGNDGDLDLTDGTGCSGAGMSWNGTTCSIDTDSKATFNFTSITIPSGKILSGTGSIYLTLLATSNVTVDGMIDLNGRDASGRTAGLGGAGGYAGGRGSLVVWSAEDSTCYGTNHNNNAHGSGPGYGRQATNTNAYGYRGGGAGHGGNGGAGTGTYGGAGGGTYDSSTNGGSGGGGATTYCSIGAYGGGGGGGGGFLKLVSNGTVTISGVVRVNGGIGGTGNTPYADDGGGGAGGKIEIIADTIVNTGQVTANGGNANGGGGGGGRITLTDNDGVISGTFTIFGGTGSAGGSAGPSVSKIAQIFNYFLSGTYTSPVIDTGQDSLFSGLTIDWNETILGDSTISVEFQTGNNADISDGIWETILTSGDSPSTAVDGKRYVQYRVTLTATTDLTQTPTFQDITINYIPYYGTLTFSPDTGYGADGVDPDTGYIEDSFTFKVVYTHINNTAPTAIKGYYTDEFPNEYEFSMFPDTGCGTLCAGNYIEGVQYTSVGISLVGVAPFTSSHKFILEDAAQTILFTLPSGGSTAGPAVKIDIPTPPILTFIASPFDDGLDPDEGDAVVTTFVYKILYTDNDNEPPSTIEVVIDGTPYAMGTDGGAISTSRDADYMNGEQYIYSRTFAIDGVKDYYFRTSDGSTAEVTTILKIGPSVYPHHPPELLSINPARGMRGEVLPFTIDGKNFFDGTTITFMGPGIQTSIGITTSDVVYSQIPDGETQTCDTATDPLLYTYCDRLTTTITIDALIGNDYLGGWSIELENPDGKKKKYRNIFWVEESMSPINKITDLQASENPDCSVGDTCQVTFTWTPLPTAANYDVRYYGGILDDSTWTVASQVIPGELIPALSVPPLTVTLPNNATWTVGVKSYNLAFDSSLLSNIVEVVLGDEIVPAPVIDLAAVPKTGNEGESTFILTWTETADNVGVTGFDIRYSSSPILTDVDFEQATQVSDTAPTPLGASTVHTMEVTGLTSDTLYYLTIKSYDAASNLSPLNTGIYPCSESPNEDSTCARTLSYPPPAIDNLQALETTGGPVAITDSSVVFTTKSDFLVPAVPLQGGRTDLADQNLEIVEPGPAANGDAYVKLGIAQTCSPGLCGTGGDAAFDDTNLPPTGLSALNGYVASGAGNCSAVFSYCIDTDNVNKLGIYNFTTVTLTSTRNVGIYGANPLIIYATGAVNITGTLDGSGRNGAQGVLTAGGGGTSGIGGPGGASGGNARESGGNGDQSATGGGGGGWSNTICAFPEDDDSGGFSGGGGAFGGDGGEGGDYRLARPGAPGIAYPNDLSNFPADAGGSGGGGGGHSTLAGCDHGGGGGGGGGGIIKIIAETITIDGTIQVNGGNGGKANQNDNTDLYAGAGGAGSGGSVWLKSPAITLTSTGAIFAKGGTGGQAHASSPKRRNTSGGGGGGGIVRTDGDFINNGTIDLTGGTGGGYDDRTYSVPASERGGTGGDGPSPYSFDIRAISASYTSRVDLNKQYVGTRILNSLSWDVDIPEGTSVDISMRAGDLTGGTNCYDIAATFNWGGWQTIAASSADGYNVQDPIPVSLAGKRCVEIKGTLASTITEISPYLNDMVLQILTPSDTAIMLTWTAVGENDDNLGTVAQYDLRHSLNSINTISNWNNATPISGLPAPQEVGSIEKMMVSSLDDETVTLTPGVPNYFAIKAIDTAGAASLLLNLGNYGCTGGALDSTCATPEATDTVRPNVITDLTILSLSDGTFKLNWTAPGDDGAASGSTSVTSYDIGYKTCEGTICSEDISDWTSRTLLSNSLTPQAMGSAETYSSFSMPTPTVTTTYQFGIRSTDDAGNISRVSNIANYVFGVIESSTTVEVNTTYDTLIVRSTLTINPGVTATADIVTVDSGASIQLNDLSVLDAKMITVDGIIKVNMRGTVNATTMIVNGEVNADGTGCRNIDGDRNGGWDTDTETCSDSGMGYTRGSGGSHGGWGGFSSSYERATIYGDPLTPFEPGGGGARGDGYTSSSSQAYGGRGGGAIRINVTETLTMNGTVSADGANGAIPCDPLCNSISAGGGAGGSIYITTNILTGAGTIHANGGYEEYQSGGRKYVNGGGGRIAIYANSSIFDQDRISVVSNDKSGNYLNSTGSLGSIHYMFPEYDLTVVAGHDQPTIDLSITSDTEWITPGTYKYKSLTITNNAALTVNKRVTIIADDITIDAGSALSADEKGCPKEQGPDFFGSVNCINYTQGGPFKDNITDYPHGGGYGGMGGTLHYFYLPGSAYAQNKIGAARGVEYGTGNKLSPLDIGSGGKGNGGAGGGAIRLRVAGTLTNNGQISANGGNSPIVSGGGGSGGSIYITTQNLLGSGAFSVKGGDGQDRFGPVGGGGGGRVSLEVAGNVEPTFSRQQIITYIGSGGTIPAEEGTAYFLPFPTDITSIPSQVGQGATNIQILITGQYFKPFTNLIISGTGIRVNSVTFDDATKEIIADISVDADAPLGSRDIILENTGLGSGTGYGVLTVTKGPSITGIVPNLGERNSRFTAIIRGTDFLENATVTMGEISILSTTINSSTSISVNLDIGLAALGPVDVTVTNPDGGTTTLQDGFTVYEDRISPSKIEDLAVDTVVSANEIQLSWTAPGNSGTVGQASFYDLRYSSNQIFDDTEFTNAQEVIGEPIPSIFGTKDLMIVNTLEGATTYWFAIKTFDENNNPSLLSNIVSATTTGGASIPDAVTNLSDDTAITTDTVIGLQWSRPQSGSTLLSYDIRYSLNSGAAVAQYWADNWNNPAEVVNPQGEPTPALQTGTTETFQVENLTPNTTYYFTIKSTNSVGESDLSSIATIATLAGDPLLPGTTTDLTIVPGSVSLFGLRLTWTAHGDDGDIGQASEYVIRYARKTLVESGADCTQINWDGKNGTDQVNYPNHTCPDLLLNPADPESYPFPRLPSNTIFETRNPILPALPLTTELQAIPTPGGLNLVSNTEYIFALKSVDDTSKQSVKSNNAVQRTALISTDDDWYGYNEVGLSKNPSNKTPNGVFGKLDTMYDIDLWEWDPSLNPLCDISDINEWRCWVAVDPTSTAIVHGKGYSLSMYEVGKIIDGSTMSDGVGTPFPEVTSAYIDTSFKQGWNIISNPYSSNIKLFGDYNADTDPLTGKGIIVLHSSCPNTNTNAEQECTYQEAIDLAIPLIIGPGTVQFYNGTTTDPESEELESWKGYRVEMGQEVTLRYYKPN